MHRCRFDVNSPLLRQPDRLAAIKARLDAVRGRNLEPVEAPPGTDPALINLLAHSAGDLNWLVWVADYLSQERRELYDERDELEERVKNARTALRNVDG